MKRFVLILGVLLLWSAVAQAVEFVEIKEYTSFDSGLKYPNTPGKEQIGDMPWIIRDRSAINDTITTVYYFKDQGSFNQLWLEEMVLYARDDAGEWFVYDQDGPHAPCSVQFGSEFVEVFSWIDLNHPRFANFTTGDRMEFRWYVRFKDFGCVNTVENNQFFQVILGEQLPLYSGQFSANTHAHSFFTDSSAIPGEWGGSWGLISPSSKAVDLDIYWWTDHGYDISESECQFIRDRADEMTDGDLLVIAGAEETSDSDTENNALDDEIHHITNVCLGTPSQIPSENQSFQLWTHQQFADSVSAHGGVRIASHPFSPTFVPDNDQVVQWDDVNIELGLSDSSFLGFQVLNKMTTTADLDVEQNHINPYEDWLVDLTIIERHDQNMLKLDAIQQQNLTSFRRVNAFAGTDNHGAYSYTVEYNRGLQVVANNNALGKIFTVVEMPTLEEADFFQALQQGECYISNGPGCQFGVDSDGNGTIENSFGSINASGDGGMVRLRAQSNGEFGEFTQATIYFIGVASRDSLVVALSGLDIDWEYPVSNLGEGASFVRVKLETTGGYGDYPGLVYTGNLYFNPGSVVSVPESTDSRFWLRLSPNVSSSQVKLSWAADAVVSSIKVLDVAGRLVWEESGMISGNTLLWQGRNRFGQNVASGIYFVSVQFEQGLRITNKLVIIK